MQRSGAISAGSISRPREIPGDVHVAAAAAASRPVAGEVWHPVAAEPGEPDEPGASGAAPTTGVSSAVAVRSPAQRVLDAADHQRGGLLHPFDRQRDIEVIRACVTRRDRRRVERRDEQPPDSGLK